MGEPNTAASLVHFPSPSPRSDPRGAAQAILDALSCGASKCDCLRAVRRGHGRTHCPAHQDNAPSLNVDVRDKVLLYCHSHGCSQDSIVEALKSRGLWSDDSRYVSDKEIVAEYDYRDAEGKLLYQALRYFPKDFRQRRPNGPGKWAWNLDGVERVLYRLPELIAAEAHRLRFVFEGEKDTDRACAMGLVGTCNVGGAGKWRDEYSQYFRGKRVVLVPHNDEPGAAHMRDVGRALQGIADEIFLLELPELDEHGDFSDWVDDGGDVDKLQALVKAAPAFDLPAKREPGITAVVANDEILYAWPEQNLLCDFSRLRETESGMVKGQLEITSTRPDSKGLVTWQMVTLSNQSDKDRIAKRLHKTSPRDEDIWIHEVEVCFQDIARTFLTVPPPVDLADVEEDLSSGGYLFKPIAPRGQVVEFLADQGTTKSYLILYLMLCTVLGRESIFGMPSVVGPAIYFDWEVDQETARRRLGWVLRGMGLDGPPRGFYYVNMSDRGKLIDRDRDMRHQIATTEAVVVAIDSLTFAAGGDLNQTELSAPTMSAIGALGDGVTKLVCTHPPKASRRDDSTRADVSAVGSGLFEFRARGIWYMQRPKDFTPSFVVSMTQHKLSDDEKYGPLFYRVTFNKAAKSVTFGRAEADDEPELADRVLSVGQKIIRYLNLTVYKQDNVGKIAKAIGEKDDTVRKTCDRMEKRGELSRLGGDGNTAVWALRGKAADSTGAEPAAEQERRDTLHLVPDMSRDTVPDDKVDPLPW